jgi:hypothetical protein
MGKVPHNFREFFTLLNAEKKTSNKRAVCNFCIKEYTLPIASVKADCFVPNKAKLCRGHLTKCVNFIKQVEKDEREKILSRIVPEDIEKTRKRKKKWEDEEISGKNNQ